MCAEVVQTFLGHFCKEKIYFIPFFYKTLNKYLFYKLSTPSNKRPGRFLEALQYLFKHHNIKARFYFIQTRPCIVLDF